jgi:hypothetical protein
LKKSFRKIGSARGVTQFCRVAIAAIVLQRIVEQRNGRMEVGTEIGRVSRRAASHARLFLFVANHGSAATIS